MCTGYASGFNSIVSYLWVLVCCTITLILELTCLFVFYFALLVDYLSLCALNYLGVCVFV